MIELTLKNGIQSNIVVIGDSGAGKSETLEAMRLMAEDEIKDMKTIFDDMGTLAIEKVKFVRTVLRLEPLYA